LLSLTLKATCSISVMPEKLRDARCQSSKSGALMPSGRLR
jgi:hypothetical protein